MSNEETPGFDAENQNPWGIIDSLQEGQDMIARLETELVYLVNDFMNLSDHMSETSVAVMQYAITKTEEAIQQLELEIKMFDQ